MQEADLRETASPRLDDAQFAGLEPFAVRRRSRDGVKQDVARASPPEAQRRQWREVGGSRAWAAQEVAAR
jgi:hypothetical protein